MEPERNLPGRFRVKIAGKKKIKRSSSFGQIIARKLFACGLPVIHSPIDKDKEHDGVMNELEQAIEKRKRYGTLNRSKSKPVTSLNGSKASIHTAPTSSVVEETKSVDDESSTIRVFNSTSSFCSSAQVQAHDSRFVSSYDGIDTVKLDDILNRLPDRPKQESDEASASDDSSSEFDSESEAVFYSPPVNSVRKTIQAFENSLKDGKQGNLLGSDRPVIVSRSFNLPGDLCGSSQKVCPLPRSRSRIPVVSQKYHSTKVDNVSPEKCLKKYVTKVSIKMDPINDQIDHAVGPVESTDVQFVTIDQFNSLRSQFLDIMKEHNESYSKMVEDLLSHINVLMDSVKLLKSNLVKNQK